MEPKGSLPLSQEATTCPEPGVPYLPLPLIQVTFVTLWQWSHY